MAPLRAPIPKFVLAGRYLPGKPSWESSRSQCHKNPKAGHQGRPWRHGRLARSTACSGLSCRKTRTQGCHRLGPATPAHGGTAGKQIRTEALGNRGVGIRFELQKKTLYHSGRRRISFAIINFRIPSGSLSIATSSLAKSSAGDFASAGVSRCLS